ncbi:MAG: carboxymuconolactone decarboxylase family protein [Acidobacteria bacterium]|nr:carboxymuconolactone decarboxylase family protein [Acidobacteriota bacterium]
MQRIPPVQLHDLNGKSKVLLENLQQTMGMTPNFYRTLANSPAALKAYLDFNQALGEGLLSERLRHRIALSVSESNGCEYCVAAYSALGRTVGMAEEDIVDSRRGCSPSRKEEAAMQFALVMLKSHGAITDEDLGRLRRVDYSDEEIIEIIAVVALTLFTNYINLAAGTRLDFPSVPTLNMP